MTASDSGRRGAARRIVLVSGTVLYAFALLLMRLSTPAGVTYESLVIQGPEGKPCGGSLWRPAEPPKAVILLGHGVSSNRGVMATIAKAYAAEGFAALALDFWGHGQSRERFDWMANPAQVLAWCAWARHAFPGLPLAYLGHSMGGFAGNEAFAERPDAADAFISLGALPRRDAKIKTLIALGEYEELFTPERAREQAAGKADVIVSPFSDHALETWDPILIRDMVAWTQSALGLAASTGFIWGRWAIAILAAAIGCIGTLLLAGWLARFLRVREQVITIHTRQRKWSLNPYRLAGRLIGGTGQAQPPRGPAFVHALPPALVFGLVFAFLLSLVLTRDIFTSRLDHPARLLAWAIASFLFVLPALFNAAALERVALHTARQRFLVATLTRALPLLALGVILRFLNPGLAFLGMLLAIFAFVSMVNAAAYTVATRAAGDYRAGALAASILFAWVITFWFPLVW